MKLAGVASALGTAELRHPGVPGPLRLSRAPPRSYKNHTKLRDPSTFPATSQPGVISDGTGDVDYEAAYRKRLMFR